MPIVALHNRGESAEEVGLLIKEGMKELRGPQARHIIAQSLHSSGYAAYRSELLKRERVGRGGLPAKHPASGLPGTTYKARAYSKPNVELFNRSESAEEVGLLTPGYQCQQGISAHVTCQFRDSIRKGSSLTGVVSRRGGAAEQGRGYQSVVWAAFQGISKESGMQHAGYGQELLDWSGLAERWAVSYTSG